jgi:hypothetical protein
MNDDAPGLCEEAGRIRWGRRARPLRSLRLAPPPNCWGRLTAEQCDGSGPVRAPPPLAQARTSPKTAGEVNCGSVPYFGSGARDGRGPLPRPRPRPLPARSLAERGEFACASAAPAARAQARCTRRRASECVVLGFLRMMRRETPQARGRGAEGTCGCMTRRGGSRRRRGDPAGARAECGGNARMRGAPRRVAAAAEETGGATAVPLHWPAPERLNSRE